jgi:predicted acylesterase/phospholipase RssA
MLTRRGLGLAAFAGTAGLVAPARADGEPSLKNINPASAKPLLCLLSIDGGGIRGVAAAAILDEIDKALRAKGGPDFVDVVDVFSGTSTGSIIAAGMAFSKQRTPDRPFWQPTRIIDIYKTRGREIFGRRPRTGLFDRSSQRWDSAGLHRVLGETFGEIRMSDLPGNLVVPYFDMNAAAGRNAVVAIGGPIASGRSGRAVRHIVAASASAPTYFNPSDVENELGIDGGVFANNPTLTAWITMQRMFDQADVLVISVGCGLKKARYPSHSTWGPIEWLNPFNGAPLIDVLMRGQSDLVDSQMSVLMDGKRNYFRFQFSLDGAKRGALDDPSPENQDEMENLARRMCAEPAQRAKIDSLVGAILRNRAELARRPSRQIPGAIIPDVRGAPA